MKSVKRSNSAHWALAEKAQGGGKKIYHLQVMQNQTRLKRVLTKTERKTIYNSIFWSKK